MATDKAQEMKDLIERLHELKKYHMMPYNLGDSGEMGEIIETLHRLAAASTPPSIEQRSKEAELKITFTDCWEFDDKIPAEGRWLANINKIMSVAAPTKEMAFEEIIISMKALLAYNSNFAPSLHTEQERMFTRDVVEFVEWLHLNKCNVYQTPDGLKWKTAGYSDKTTLELLQIFKRNQTTILP